MTRIALIAALYLFSAAAIPVLADSDRQIQQQIRFDQKIGASVPEDAAFVATDGSEVRIGNLLRDKPVVLMLAWFACPNLCSVAMDGLARGLAGTGLAAGDDFDVVTVSIDPTETAEEGGRVRRALELRNGGGPSEWNVLTGTEPAIRRLADAVGFRYAYDADSRQYAHPAGVILLDDGGRVARYLFGMQFAARDLKLGLIDTARGELGSPVDQLLLRCHSFDPATGRYSLAVMNVLRLGGGGFALLLFSVVGGWWLRDLRRRNSATGATKGAADGSAG